MTTSARKSWMGELSSADPKISKPKAKTSYAKPLSAVSVPKNSAGMTSDRLRVAMTERLRQAGIAYEPVLQAMARVPRHKFVDEALASRAYENTALPIGQEQTISQPYVVAKMVELLSDAGNAHLGKILEIGTGCGYQAAVLSLVAQEVYSIERIRVLYDRARVNLRPLRLSNLRLVYGDGMLGIPEAAPFDGMVIAAAAPDLPIQLLKQLRIGGRALAPLGAADGNQIMCLIVRTGENKWSRTELEPVRFVPIKAGLD